MTAEQSVAEKSLIARLVNHLDSDPNVLIIESKRRSMLVKAEGRYFVVRVEEVEER